MLGSNIKKKVFPCGEKGFFQVEGRFFPCGEKAFSAAGRRFFLVKSWLTVFL